MTIIYKTAVKILGSQDLTQPIRLRGVRITNLQYTSSQLPLFPEEQTKLKLTKAMDKVSIRHSDFTVMFGSYSLKKAREPCHFSSMATGWHQECWLYNCVIDQNAP